MCSHQRHRPPLATLHELLQDIYIILFSTFNCKGRMLGGYLSDAYSKRLNRAGWLTLALVSMAAAMVLTAFSDATGLLFAVSWAGGERVTAIVHDTGAPTAVP